MRTLGSASISFIVGIEKGMRLILVVLVFGTGSVSVGVSVFVHSCSWAGPIFRARFVVLSGWSPCRSGLVVLLVGRYCGCRAPKGIVIVSPDSSRCWVFWVLMFSVNSYEGVSVSHWTRVLRIILSFFRISLGLFRAIIRFLQLLAHCVVSAELVENDIVWFPLSSLSSPYGNSPHV